MRWAKGRGNAAQLIILHYNRLITMNSSLPSGHPTVSTNELLLPPTLDSQDMSEQLPGMKEVLMNSLRINKKLHGEIVAREHSVRNQAQQANAKLNSLYRDMEEVYTKTQQLYEETVRQNQKTRYMAEELLKPFREELKGKVDETTLSLKMKMMLSEFDNLGHKISYDRQGKAVEDDQNHTFRFIRMELLPLISKLEEQAKDSVAIAHRQQEEVNNLHKKQEEMTKDILKSKEMLFQVKSSLMDEIAIKLSEEVWDERMNAFYNGFIRNNIDAMAHSISGNHKELSLEVKSLKEQVTILAKNNNDTKIAENKKRIEQLKVDIGKLSKNSTSQESLISQLKKSIEETKHSIQRQLNQLVIPNISKEQITQLSNQIRTIRQQSQEITSHLHSQLQKALQSNDKSLYMKVNKLDSDFKSMSQHVKLTQKQVQGQQSELTFIKDLLSKKANFTDIIVHTQNKADKQDYQELKHLIQHSHTPVETMPHTDPEPDLDSCMITQEEPQDECTPTPNRFRKRQSTSGRKNRHSVSPFVGESDRDDSVKRYMLGLKNGATNYTRENLLREKTRFMFLNQTERRQPKNVRRGETFTENFV